MVSVSNKKIIGDYIDEVLLKIFPEDIMNILLKYLFVN